MKPAFTCQAVSSINGTRQILLVADDGKRLAHIWIVAPHEFFEEDETPRQALKYCVKLPKAAKLAK